MSFKYYPILRGKQFDLLAIKDIASKISHESRIFPIIEPVRDNFNAINRTIKSCIDSRLSIGLIFNPIIGDLSKISIEQIKSNILHSDSECFTAIFHLPKEIDEKFWEQVNSFSRVGFIIHASSDKNCNQFKSLFGSGKIRIVLFSDEDRRLKTLLRGNEIPCVLIKDKFKQRRRNADYLEVDDELFTEEHIYACEDKYDGFSDYTLMPAEYTEGGWLPYAVAIHLSYQNSDNQVFVKHFISDSNTDTSDIQGKFEEALDKALAFFKGRTPITDGIRLLEYYKGAGEYPGLGILKKISIMHHLELMDTIVWNENI